MKNNTVSRGENAYPVLSSTFESDRARLSIRRFRIFENLSGTNIYDLPGPDLGVISNSKCVQSAVDDVPRRWSRFIFPEIVNEITRQTLSGCNLVGILF